MAKTESGIMDEAPTIYPTRLTLIGRGLSAHCPKCGQGKLYFSYLKVVKNCSSCGEELSSIRADDGPAWLTIIVTGHLTVPVVIYLSMHTALPAWLAFLLILLYTLAVALAFLPRAKGVFIGMTWLNAQTKHLKSSKYDHLAKIP